MLREPTGNPFPQLDPPENRLRELAATGQDARWQEQFGGMTEYATHIDQEALSARVDKA